MVFPLFFFFTCQNQLIMKKILFILAAFALFSCSENNDNDGGTQPGLLKQMTIANIGGITTYTYSYVGNHLSYIISPNQYKRIIYNGNLITGMNTYNNSDVLLESRVFQYGSNDKIILSVTLDYAGGLGIKEMVSYNADGTVTVNTYSGDLAVQTSLTQTKLVHFSNGEIVHTVTQIGPDSLVSDYTFDNKQNPMKTITGLDKLNVLQPDGEDLAPTFFSGMHNNCIKIVNNWNNGAHIDTINYQLGYNAANFATSNCPDENNTTLSDLSCFGFTYYP